jgi:uncharacterized protein
MPEPRLAAIWRHPVKGIGAEPLEEVALEAGRTMPGDRVWAVAHEASRAVDGEWTRCAGFLRGAGAPQLMAVTARTEADGRITLAHPDRPTVTLDPVADADRLVAWVRPLVPEGRAAPVRVVSAGRGMTDSPAATVSVLSLASLRALSQAAGRDLSPRRFRGNLWVEDLAPWQEFEWPGREIAIGPVRLRVTDRIARCAATTVDPETGRPDTDVPGILDARWGHGDFGVEAEVLAPGTVRLGDPVRA